MYSSPTTTRFYLLFSMVLLTTLVSSSAFAADFTSANFTVRDSVSNDFGGTSTSSSFSSVSSGNDIAQTLATSTSFVLNSGYMFFETFVPKTQNWRWYDDAENETPSSPLDSENTAPANVQATNVVALRITVADTAGVSSEHTKFRLQFSTSSTFSSGAVFVAETANCNGGSEWCYESGGAADNSLISTGLLSDSDACVASVGNGCGTHNTSGTSTSSYTQPASAVSEYEFTLQQSGATANTVYFFRLYNTASSSSVPTNTGETYPSISTSGTTLTFSIDGIASTTATEGITTDIDTTPTAVLFGTLLPSTPVAAAHRLTVTTNANQGYKIYAFQRQGLISANAEITPVLGTNASPSAWTSGCTGGAPGCYGYHSGEDVLEGGSTRFAADDTYAQFTTTPSEVAYNAGPAASRVTDVVYKVEARSLQAAGEYESDLVFIVAPTF